MIFRSPPKVVQAARPRIDGEFITRLILVCALFVSGAASAETVTPGAEAVVRVNRETGGHCTGFAIDRHRVVTAAHCLWLARPMNWIRPSSLHVLIGYDRGEYRQHLRVTAYRVGADFQPKVGGGQSSDWAILELDGGFDGAPLPLASSPARVGEMLAVIGFAGTRGHRLTRHVSCRVHKAGPNAFLHGCPAGKGHSGGPLFAWRGERRVALGLHVAVSRTQGYAVQAKSIREDAARRPY